MSDPARRTITLLCSGVALGVYVPALHVSRQLRERGAATEVVVLEGLFAADKQARIAQNKLAFHRDFAVARMGQRMARDARPNLDVARVEALYRRWLGERRRLFIVFSGFWMPILDEYRRRLAPAGLWAHLLHMDAAVSASWSRANLDYDGYQPVWLFSAATGQLSYQLIEPQEPVIPYDQRPLRYLIHGGGWGMGTYRGAIPALEAAGLDLDIVAYEREEAAACRPGQRYFMVDPAWSPWQVDQQGEHEFPPFGQVAPGGYGPFGNRPDSHELLRLARQARAIISKPGGATLLDSWAAATPLVMLDPFGDYEAQNAALWQTQGFGVPFEAWQAAGFSPHLLEPLHRHLLRAQGEAPYYVEAWWPRFREYLGRA